MHPEPETNDLKRSALDLLASGNSAHAVAEVLGVPIATVDAWGRGGGDTVPQAQPIEPPAAHPPHRPTIEPTGFIAEPPITRVIAIVVPLFLFALALTANLGETLREAQLGWVWPLVVVGGLALGASAIAYGLRSGFELTSHGVVWQGAWSRRELAYAEIASGSITRNPKLDLYVLSLKPRSGSSGVTIWLDADQVRQPGIADWIDSLRQPGDEPFVPKPRRDESDDSDDGGFVAGLIKVLIGVQVLVMVGLVFLEGSQFLNDMRLLIDGPPALESLDLTEGALVDRGPCLKPGKGAPSQVVKIDTGAVLREFNIPCMIDRATFLKPGTRHMAIRTDDRRFADHEKYSIELDGVALEAYDTHVARKLRYAKTTALIEFTVIALILALLGYVGKRLLDRWRR
jgi:hypothetical protein